MRFIPILATTLIVGCISRTQTLVPSFSGVITDFDSNPLTDVLITDITAPSEVYSNVKAEIKSSAANGAFNFESITLGTVKTLPSVGAGTPVSRLLRFRKAGFNDVNCEAMNLSLFGKKNQAQVVMVPWQEGLKIPKTLPYLQVSDSVRCQVYPGQLVIYKKQRFKIISINQSTTAGNSEFYYELRNLEDTTIFKGNIPEHELCLAAQTL